MGRILANTTFVRLSSPYLLFVCSPLRSSSHQRFIKDLSLNSVMFKYFKTGTYYINPVLKPWTHYGRFGRDQRVDGLLRALSTNQRLTTHSPTVHPPTSLVGVVRIVVPVRADLSAFPYFIPIGRNFFVDCSYGVVLEYGIGVDRGAR